MTFPEWAKTSTTICWHPSSTPPQRRKSPPSQVAAAETHLFWKSSPDLAVPDTQPIHFSLPMYGEGMYGPATASPSWPELSGP